MLTYNDTGITNLFLQSNIKVHLYATLAYMKNNDLKNLLHIIRLYCNRLISMIWGQYQGEPFVKFQVEIAPQVNLVY